MPESERCAACDGDRIQGEHCLAHLTPCEWERELERLRRGEPLHARRAPISKDLLSSLFADLRRDSDGRVHLPSVDFHAGQFFGDVDFSEARFSDHADFSEARFAGDATFRETQVCGSTDFSGARFSGACRLGPLRTESLTLSDADLLEHVTIEVRANSLCAEGTQFRSGADISAQSAEIRFDRATFNATTMVSTASCETDSKSVLADTCGKETLASVISLQRARIS